MTEKEFPKRFDFREAEPRIYAAWEKADAFSPAYAPDGRVLDAGRAKAKPYVIVIPPPNITGRLHMGHALNNTVQDVLVRWRRMAGDDVLWVPGTDHAGIATQSIVKKQLDAQGIDYRALGREEVVRRIWAWKEEFGGEILKQLRRIGTSCDWSRTRFTMDEGLSRAVRHAFVELYHRGLIYRGKRIVNWCPVDRTALSDDEVEKEDTKAKMFHIRYPFADDPTNYLVVATTRPETLFGDVAVAVNAKDPRHAHAIGRHLRLPLQGRVIPVIADSHADPEKGTGVVKITPAHDPNDFEVGQRHNLIPINVMNEDATMNDVVPEAYRNLDRYQARKKALAELESLGLLDAVKDHEMAVGSSYRSKVPIEYRLCDQWFVRMEPLAEMALQKSGYVRASDGWTKSGVAELSLHPENLERVYFHWLSNIKDWCISRQIWWGHRIPAWYHKETGEILVGLDTPEPARRNPDQWTHDEDVLDTWFSSWLWPMSTLGWPDKSHDYQRYYPTTVLSTAQDILFFWVARMNFAGLVFDGRLPYRDVYLHSTIADEHGKKVSKSAGNGIDPVVVIDGGTVDDLKRAVFEARPPNMKEILDRIQKRFPEGFEAVGADAMRFTLIFSITDGDFVRLYLDRFREGRNFVTKLWNGAGRIITALEEEVDKSKSQSGDPIAPYADEDRWLFERMNSTARTVTEGLSKFDFGKMAKALYHFTWDDYCSWALEFAKARLLSPDVATRRGALSVMGTVLADLLRLLHPITPFVTEELWSRLIGPMTTLGLWSAEPPSSTLLIRDRFVTATATQDASIEARFDALKRLVIAVRQLRARCHINDHVELAVEVKSLSKTFGATLSHARPSVMFLARLSSVEFVDERKKGMVTHFDPDFELAIDLRRYVDVKTEIERTQKTIAKTEKEVATQRAGLENKAFLEHAPQEKIAEKRAAVQEAEARLVKLKAELSELVEIERAT